MAGQIDHRFAAQAARVVVRIRAAVVTCRSVAVRELDRETAADQRFERLVDGCE
jgi:hypothetical protein